MDSLSILSEQEIFGWRIMLVRRLMRAVVLLSIPVVLASSYYAVVEGTYLYIPIYLALLAGLIIVTYWERVPDNARMVSLMTLMYLLVLLDYFTEGRGSLAPTFLLALAFSGALFFGLRGAVIAMVIDMLTVAIFAYLYTYNILPDYLVSSKGLAGWISNSTIIILLVAFIGLSLNFVIHNMTVLVRKGNELNLALGEERENLETKVVERTVDLQSASEKITRLVETLTQVSDHIEHGEFDPKVLSELIDRPDAFGQLARVFLDMGYEVSAREKRLRMLRVVIPAGVAMNAERNFNRLLETIVVEAQQLCNADGSSLYLLKQTELEYIVARNSMLNIAFGGTSENKSTFSPLPLYNASGQPNLQYAAVRVALTGNRLIVDDVYGDLPENLDLSMVKAFDQKNDYHSQSMMAIPLIDNNGKVVGVLQLINARDHNKALIPFHPDDVLESLVLLGAAALTSFWREEKLRAEIDQLRIEIDQALKAKQVSEVTETDYFKSLKIKANELRNARSHS